MSFAIVGDSANGTRVDTIAAATASWLRSCLCWVWLGASRRAAARRAKRAWGAPRRPASPDVPAG